VSRQLVIRDQALEEIAEAAEWYERRSAGLSADFLRAVDVAVASVLRAPEQYPGVHQEMHRALLRRFPYSLVYSFDEEELVVLGCLHWRRDPERWRARR